MFRIIYLFLLFFLFHSLQILILKLKQEQQFSKIFSGEILYEKTTINISSINDKIMTSIIAFDLIKTGDLNLDDKFIVSENAWRLSTAGYSSMFIMVGDEVSVKNLLLGIIIASNDA